MDLIDFIVSFCLDYSCLFQSPIISYEEINDLSLLIHVSGQNKTLTPYMLAAHFDVVPVIQDQWTYDGFTAIETDNGTMLYGRGTIDNKVSVIVSKIDFLKFLID